MHFNYFLVICYVSFHCRALLAPLVLLVLLVLLVYKGCLEREEVLGVLVQRVKRYWLFYLYSTIKQTLFKEDKRKATLPESIFKIIFTILFYVKFDKVL